MASPAKFLKNLFHLAQYGLVAELNDCQRQLQEQAERLLYLEMKDMDDERFREELAFIRSEGKVCVFPYPALRRLDGVQTGRDAVSGLPYAVHKGHKLFFPRN